MITYILEEKIKRSKEILKLASEMSKYYYHKPLIITYSGGKDSDVMLQLARECLGKDDFEVLNSHTTLDAPETVYYIRDKFAELEKEGVKATVNYPRKKDGSYNSIWRLIEEKGAPPTRIMRYCCAELKEKTTPNRFVAVGVRSAESAGRKGRDVFATRGKTKKDAYYYYYYSHVKEVFDTARLKQREAGGGNNDANVWDCTFIKKAKENKNLITSPIYDWEDSDVWNFIRDRKLKYNPLYNKGYNRVGCIGCPMSTRKKQELDAFPIYKKNFIRCFERMLKNTKEETKEKMKWKTGEDVYNWWVEDKTIKGQMDINDFIN